MLAESSADAVILTPRNWIPPEQGTEVHEVRRHETTEKPMANWWEGALLVQACDEVFASSSSGTRNIPAFPPQSTAQKRAFAGFPWSP
ncbi:MAG TPA: hypothetical protein VLB12_00480 [Gemmatimonadales bacterium]|nr:hypothetical protein [Gemmatimonadales bacterium]